MKTLFNKPGRLISALLMCCFVVSCARSPDPKDPFEHYNRNTYRMNKKIDEAFFEPLAKGYKAITIYPIRRSVSNFFDNLNETKNIGNDILQGRIYWTFNDLWRFIVNSTVGVVGLFDVASDIGLHKHTNSFKLTLNTWGYTNTAYVVVPFLGSSTEAGVVGIPVDFALTPWRYKLHPWTLEESLYGLEIINKRATYLDQQDLAAQLSFDPYVFMRSAYQQNQAYLMKQNENPPIKNTIPAKEAAEAAQHKK